MFIDAHTLPNEADIHTDVCIIGSGPAGLAIAREFIGHDLTVALLESGGQGLEKAPQSLSEGESPLTLTDSRRRQFGGNASIWTVDFPETKYGIRYMPLSKADFEHREWIAHSGWPMTREQLDPLYARAQQVCQIGPYAYGPEAWATATTQPLPINDDRVMTGMYQFGGGEVFLNTHRVAIERAKNITTYLHATVVELETNDTASEVTRVRVASTAERRFSVTARYVILASGGVEAARLLLLSDRVQQHGLGNSYDQVGRYMMDHPLIRGGEFVPASQAMFDTATLYDLRNVNGTTIMAYLGLSDELLRREQLLNMSMMLYPRSPQGQFSLHHSESTERNIDSARRVRKAIRQHQIPKAHDLLHAVAGAYGIGSHALQVKRHPESHINRGGWSHMKQRSQHFTHFEVFHQTEQAPYAENRLLLGNDRDMFGSRRVKVEWKWHQQDIERIQRGQALFAKVLHKAGLGEYRIATEADGRPMVNTITTHHHMGTTRMHSDPRQGVVDATCKVHGVANLFIASSSVFPTGGFANPTLTIVAMALYVADQVKLRERQTNRVDLRATLTVPTSAKPVKVRVRR